MAHILVMECRLVADFVAEVRFEGRIGRPVDFEADARPLLSDSPRGAAALTL